ncbi:Serine/threonine-protein kinase CtkA [Paraliobacillus sp. PM-2]|uniref:HipA domain-containing protein n=1 Tax=Paraliobacillus sp. PM-2 TaxID=1462524 RepID=UPI00061C19CA|nr:HipA domain-containing protein [Paraliobacillus sp. PM-2]CQR46244.1 Serine/threonine-protein kinase CtkA [Paraliobacillus sp. PM-2]
MIKNVSNWKKDMKSQASGTRAKFWLENPTDEIKYLFKIPTENTGEYWAEYISSQIGQLIGIDVMHVELASYNGIIGTIAKNFVEKNEEFYEGGDLFFNYFPDFDRYQLKHYELPNILTVLSEYSVERDFIIIPVFDTFIGNQDRHCDNWGIINSENGFHLSPIYDNGSSMGFNLSEERIHKMLRDKRMFKGFCNRGKAIIGLPGSKKTKFLDLLTYINNCFPLEFKQSLEKINRVNDTMICNVLSEIPDSIMSEVYKEWVRAILLYRKKWIVAWYERRL